MVDEQHIRAADGILDKWREYLGRDYDGYRNHVQRVVAFTLAQAELDPDEQRKVVIAATFHDLGIWSAGTFDYLPPSVALASVYLRENALGDWIPEVADMITQHHRLRPAQKPETRLTEYLRRADLVDLSLGAIGCGIDKETRRTVRQEFPNNGFHRCLLRISAAWIVRHPLRPIPVLKW